MTILHPYTWYLTELLGEVTATELQPRTTYFLNEHSTIWSSGQFGQMVECLFQN